MTTVNSGKWQFPQYVVYRQAKSLWLMTEPLGQLARIRPGLLESNYAGRHCERILDHEDIAVVVALGGRQREPQQG